MSVSICVMMDRRVRIHLGCRRRTGYYLTVMAAAAARTAQGPPLRYGRLRDDTVATTHYPTSIDSVTSAPAGTVISVAPPEIGTSVSSRSRNVPSHAQPIVS